MLSTVIPTYKNQDRFIKNLKCNLPFLEDVEIIIVNDDPSQSLVEPLKRFKNVVLIENKSNLGFAGSVNLGVEKARNKYVILLNSDVALNDRSYRQALNQFKADDRLFTVGFAQKEKNNQIVGKNIIYWRRGLFCHDKAVDLEAGFSAWAEGGACMVDRKKFVDLGGFDTLYSPFYWEDIDLCYRAWKSGYKILFNPKIIVDHHHGSTISKYFLNKEIEKIAFRNQLIFTWKNVSDLPLVLTHLFFLPYNLVYYLIKNKAFLEGFMAALKNILNILIRRQSYPLSDRFLFSLFKQRE